MRTLIPGRPALLAALLLTLAGGAPAADDKPQAALPDAKTLDAYLNQALKEAVNQGAELYNAKRYYDCHQVYQRALDALRPVLTYRPELLKSMDKGLAEIDKDRDVRLRLAKKAGHPDPQKLDEDALKAWALRAVIDDVRAALRTAEPAPADKKTLWERLGGEDNVKKVIDDLITLAADDPKVNFTRDGKYKLDVPQLKKQLLDLVSAHTGGPYKYKGRDMKEVHKGMGITNAEFDALAADLKQALKQNGAKDDDITAVLAVVESTRAAIVEVKKPDDKKPDDKPKGKPVPVQGKVTLDGKPLDKAVIRFVPADEPKAKGYESKTGVDGTYAFEKDVVPGKYIVVVTAQPSPDDKPPKVSIPARYQDPAKSDLTVVVREGKDNYDLALSK